MKLLINAYSAGRRSKAAKEAGNNKSQTITTMMKSKTMEMDAGRFTKQMTKLFFKILPVDA